MLAVQLCPNDHPPFLDVCVGHARALALCGYRVRTIFFESRGRAQAHVACESIKVVAVDRVAASLGDARPDLLVSHRYRGYRTGIELARRVAIAKHVAVAHEFGFFARSRRRWRRRLLGDGACRLAGVSNAVAADLVASGVQEPLVLPNPIDAAQLCLNLRTRQEARAELRLATDDFVIGVVGRLHPKKDPARALRAFHRCRRVHPRARLVFVGDGELRPGLERVAGEGVVFTGFRADGRELLKAFDVVLACATVREAFGLTLLEALAAGVPVICADRPGPRFVLGDCATYFAGDDELDVALRRAIEQPLPGEGGAGRRRAERLFSTAALAARYRSALR